eukprot:COSAG05_NODE_3751_length_1862_cov_1.258083_3_plen_34_part_01
MACARSVAATQVAEAVKGALFCKLKFKSRTVICD